MADATTLPLEAPDQLLITIGQPDHRQVLDRVAAFAPMGYAVAVGALIAFALAFVAARRRWTVLVGIGLGTLVLAGAWKLAADAVAARGDRNVQRQRSRGDLQERVCRAAGSSFGQWILAAAVVGGVLLAAGLVLRVVGVRRRA